MTTAPPAPPDVIALPPRGTGERQRRRMQRRQLQREQVLVLLVLLLALVVTVVVLGQQWLASGVAGGSTGTVSGLTASSHSSR